MVETRLYGIDIPFGRSAFSRRSQKGTCYTDGNRERTVSVIEAIEGSGNFGEVVDEERNRERKRIKGIVKSRWMDHT